MLNSPILLLIVAGVFGWWLLTRYLESRKPLKRDISRLSTDNDDEDDDAVDEIVDTEVRPLKPQHRRLTYRDPRLLPKPRKRRWGEKRKKIMEANEANRLFATSLRTRNRQQRDLLTDAEQLQRYGLPLWQSENDIAAALNISVGTLRHYAIHREMERVSHYVQFAIPKRRGGERLILAPKRQLKKIQRQLKKVLVSQLPVSDYAHGFRPQRSIATHAANHVGQAVVIKMDLKEFFPSLHVGRIRGLLIALGYSYPVAATLALLMTEAERQPVQVGDSVFHTPVGQRHAVQGAPTSPGLANAITRTLDHRLAGLARKMGYRYSRYADDLTFSGADPSTARALLKSVQRIVHAEGFRLHPDKTAIMTQKGAQKITGVTVNKDMGLSRKERRRIRAAIHNARQKGDTGVLNRLRGKLAFLNMLNPQQANKLKQKLEQQ